MQRSEVGRLDPSNERSALLLCSHELSWVESVIALRRPLRSTSLITLTYVFQFVHR
jgi:hypothetical protein